MIQVTSDPRAAIRSLTEYSKLCTGPRSVEASTDMAAETNALYWEYRDAISQVYNAAPATNTIDSALKRTLILNESVRAFAVRLAPLKLFATSFQNVPLEGTSEVVVTYFPLVTTASSDRTTTNVPSYVFGQATSTLQKTITVDKIKYQPLDYSSYEFNRQPWFNSVRLGALNAEKLAVDVLRDVLSVVTAANFGAPVLTSSAANISSDDVIDLRGICNDAMWPDMGRSLIVDSSVDTSLQKDSSYKLALNIGTTSVIQQGTFPKLSGFDYAFVPSLPSNSESLIGFAAFASGILAAFAPIDPPAGVRAQLAAYQVVTDASTGISFNYRHWGVGSDDRDYEVIECAYGYAAGVPAAIKRIVSQ